MTQIDTAAGAVVGDLEQPDRPQATTGLAAGTSAMAEARRAIVPVPVAGEETRVYGPTTISEQETPSSASPSVTTGAEDGPVAELPARDPLDAESVDEAATGAASTGTANAPVAAAETAPSPLTVPTSSPPSESATQSAVSLQADPGDDPTRLGVVPFTAGRVAMLSSVDTWRLSPGQQGVAVEENARSSQVHVGSSPTRAAIGIAATAPLVPTSPSSGAPPLDLPPPPLAPLAPTPPKTSCAGGTPGWGSANSGHQTLGIFPADCQDTAIRDQALLQWWATAGRVFGLPEDPWSHPG